MEIEFYLMMFTGGAVYHKLLLIQNRIHQLSVLSMIATVCKSRIDYFLADYELKFNCKTNETQSVFFNVWKRKFTDSC